MERAFEVFVFDLLGVGYIWDDGLGTERRLIWLSRFLCSCLYLDNMVGSLCEITIVRGIFMTTSIRLDITPRWRLPRQSGLRPEATSL